VGGGAAEALAVGGPPADVRVALSRQLESLRAAAQGARAEQRARDDQPANAVRSRPSSLAA
jgi:hypothetical protein